MHWFLDPIQYHYVDFEGRVGRQEFWMYILGYVIGYVLVSVVDSDALSALYGLALLLPGLSITARRLHDTGKSGWWQLIALIPILGAIVLIIFCVGESEPAANMYGPVPSPKANSTTAFAVPTSAATTTAPSSPEAAAASERPIASVTPESEPAPNND